MGEVVTLDLISLSHALPAQVEGNGHNYILCLCIHVLSLGEGKMAHTHIPLHGFIMLLCWWD